MRNLTIMEQQAQSIMIMKFYQTLVILEEFMRTLVFCTGVLGAFMIG